MNALCNHFVYPYHRIAAWITSALPFSAMELLYTAVGIFAITVMIRCGVLMARRRERLKRLYRTFISLLCLGAVFFSGYCLLWNTTYYADSFSQKSGLEKRLVSAEELKAVTVWFVDIINEYAPMVERDENRLFSEDEDALFDRASTLYNNAEERFPALDGYDVRPKKMTYALLMSHMNFTGVFFPFTGEANVNTNSPSCLIPATLAHEIAHQRGVAAEDEANFVAIMACLESGDPVFTYSAALLAYIHLGNALYDSDYDFWKDMYYQIDDLARADLRGNNEYWKQFKTKTAQISETLYSGFLQSNGQEQGIKSYGACIDLLVAYYYAGA